MDFKSDVEILTRKEISPTQSFPSVQAELTRERDLEELTDRAERHNPGSDKHPASGKSVQRRMLRMRVLR